MLYLSRRKKRTLLRKAFTEKEKDMPEILAIASITCLFIGIGYLLKAIFFNPYTGHIKPGNQGAWKTGDFSEKIPGDET